MGTGVGAYPLLTQPPARGNFLYCLWSKESNPAIPMTSYTRKVPLTNLRAIYDFNKEEIKSISGNRNTESIWLSIIDNTAYLVVGFL